MATRILVANANSGRCGESEIVSANAESECERDDRMSTEMGIVKEAEIEGRGRGLVAARRVTGGEVLLKEAPILVYMDAGAARAKNCCHQCLRTLPGPVAGPEGFPCASCSDAFFCSSSCQIGASSTWHTPWVCQALGALVSAGKEEEVETQARFLIAVYNLAVTAPQSFEKLRELSGPVEVDDGVRNVHQLVHDVVGDAVLPKLFDLDLSGSLLAKDRINAFGLLAPPSKDDERRVRAYAFYLQASLFNHNCLPNACRFDYLERPGTSNTDISIRALDDIDPGTEVCVSYFPINWPYAARQKKLSQEYGFQCECSRCLVERKWVENVNAEDADEGEDDDDEDSDDEDDVSSPTETDKDIGKLAVSSPSGAEGASKEEEEAEDEEDDFPHAFFFVEHLCPAEQCGGTMAPLPPPSSGMECNMCGIIRSNEALVEALRLHSILT